MTDDDGPGWDIVMAHLRFGVDPVVCALAAVGLDCGAPTDLAEDAATVVVATVFNTGDLRPGPLLDLVMEGANRHFRPYELRRLLEAYQVWFHEHAQAVLFCLGGSGKITYGPRDLRTALRGRHHALRQRLCCVTVRRKGQSGRHLITHLPRI